MITADQIINFFLFLLLFMDFCFVKVFWFATWS